MRVDISYLKNMERKKGVIAIVTKDGKILMGKKKHKPGHFLSDKWHFPGGKAEEGESFEDALIREMKEELNVVLNIESTILEYEYHFGEHVGDSTVFHCTSTDELVAGDDLVEIGFFDYDEILNLHDKDTFNRLPIKVKQFIYKFFHKNTEEIEYKGNDFYCDMVLSGRIDIDIVEETSSVLAFKHTKPYWLVHIVVIPKKHISSLITLEKTQNDLLIELMHIVKKIAKNLVDEKGEARVLTNLGNYQDSKHLHFHVSSGKALK